MNPVILIPARLKATRLPDKPLADIAGEPMIVHVWRQAVAANIGPVWVACDDVRIKAAVEKAGGKAVMTREDHPSGSDRIWEALQKIDAQGNYDVIVNVQGDVPTIDPAVIRAVLTPLANNDVDIATLACEIKDADERTDPSVVKPVFAYSPSPRAGEGREGGEAASENATGSPPSLLLRGGSSMRAISFTRTPKDEGMLYHHIGIYAYRKAALARFVSLPPSAGEMSAKLEQLRAIDAGMRIDAAIVDTVPLGVDTPEHLEKARRIVISGW